MPQRCSHSYCHVTYVYFRHGNEMSAPATVFQADVCVISNGGLAKTFKIIINFPASDVLGSSVHRHGFCFH